MKILWKFLWEVIQTVVALSFFLGSMWLLFSGLISASSELSSIGGLMTSVFGWIIVAIAISTGCIVSAINRLGERK